MMDVPSADVPVDDGAKFECLRCKVVFKNPLDLRGHRKLHVCPEAPPDPRPQAESESDDSAPPVLAGEGANTLHGATMKAVEELVGLIHTIPTAAVAPRTPPTPRPGASWPRPSRSRPSALDLPSPPEHPPSEEWTAISISPQPQLRIRVRPSYVQVDPTQAATNDTCVFLPPVPRASTAPNPLRRRHRPSIDLCRNTTLEQIMVHVSGVDPASSDTYSTCLLYTSPSPRDS
eukprot:TRINITY_DN348_c0_g2_i1.p1 TRINITY_DN348_c0_g2~~TRINITY_DN348_c0_g2_i1.p1  ORF type:complete len:232 (+),score=22.56 TRINITY_DN348_c0_g2_i1:284-979(+)